VSGRRIVVGVCTAGRASLAETLVSLSRQTLRPCLTIVSDNAEDPEATERTMAGLELGGLPVLLVHAPALNLSVARNACLDAGDRDLLAFIDDDEVAPPGWLERLSAALSPGLAAVFGPTRAVYGGDAPAWMREARLHDQAAERHRGELWTGHTGNCLVDLAHPAVQGLRFDERFGRTGGEDTAFFASVHARGGRFAFAPGAHVEEPVPEARASLGWLLRRKVRSGQSAYAAGRRDPAHAASLALTAPAKVAYCALRAGASPDRGARARWLMRGALHWGVLREAVGLRAEEQYGGRVDTRPSQAGRRLAS
jgi:succinoglycan biosynthesis protein ExoM